MPSAQSDKGGVDKTLELWLERRRGIVTTGYERSKSACIIVYDGECPFCQKQMAWVRARDPQEQFEFVPSQTPDLTKRFPALEGEDLDSGLRLLQVDGSVLSSADAVYEIARRLPRWRWLAWLYRVPGLRALARSFYRWIAAHRHVLKTDRDEPGGL